MANVPISIDQGGAQMTIGPDATLTIEGELEVSGGGSITPGDDSITTDMIQDDAITSPKLNDLAVTTAKLSGQAVTFATSLMFVSTEQTGDDMPQNIAHGLGVVPSAVLIVPTDTAPATTGVYTSTQGTHTSTNVVVTVTAGKKYVVWAMG